MSFYFQLDADFFYLMHIKCIFCPQFRYSGDFVSFHRKCSVWVLFRRFFLNFQTILWIFEVFKGRNYKTYRIIRWKCANIILFNWKFRIFIQFHRCLHEVHTKVRNFIVFQRKIQGFHPISRNNQDMRPISLNLILFQRKIPEFHPISRNNRDMRLILHILRVFMAISRNIRFHRSKIREEMHDN